MMAPESRRKSGLSAGEEEAKADSERLLEQGIEEASLPIEDDSSKRKFRTPGFHRMKVDFTDDERIIVKAQIDRANQWLRKDFPDAFEIMEEIYAVVRDQAIDHEDKPMFEADGSPTWVKTLTGHIQEDYGRLTIPKREHFLQQITTWLFIWEQIAQDIWVEAMFARAAWEEKHAIDYDAPRGKTMGERDALAKKGAIDERYFAIFLAYYSKKAEALLRSMQGITRRLERGVQV